MNPLTFGSLFAGIGGFDLGFERAGLRCKWQVEINEFCRKVLAKHWPNVRRHDDVKTFPPEGSDLDEWRVDVICGGFPCQDISVAGRGAGIEGERSGLWSEYSRIVRLLRPRFVVVENVPALLGRGLHRVLGDLAACGYDAEWDCLPAAAVGAPHLRERVFIVAHADRERREEQHAPALAARAGFHPRIFASESVPDSEGERRREGRAGRTSRTGAGEEDAAVLADTGSVGRERRPGVEGVGRQEAERGEAVGDTGNGSEARTGRVGFGHWRSEPAVGRVADGVPNRVDRLRGLGNAVVPQVAQWLGERLIEAHIHEDASDAM